MDDGKLPLNRKVLRKMTAKIYSRLSVNKRLPQQFAVGMSVDIRILTKLAEKMLSKCRTDELCIT